MQHGVSSGLDHGLEQHWSLVHKALLVMAAGFGALVVSWIGYLLMVGAFILWG